MSQENENYITPIFPLNSEEFNNFEEENPINIFDKSFWKIRAYIHPSKDLLLNERTGLIVEPIDTKNVKLYGRCFNNEVVLCSKLDSTIINWCKDCGIIIEEDVNDSENEGEDEEEYNNSEDEN